MNKLNTLLILFQLKIVGKCLFYFFLDLNVPFLNVITPEGESAQPEENRQIARDNDTNQMLNWSFLLFIAVLFLFWDLGFHALLVL